MPRDDHYRQWRGNGCWCTAESGCVYTSRISYCSIRMLDRPVISSGSYRRIHDWKVGGDLRWGGCRFHFFPPSLGSLPLLLHPRFTHSLYPAPIFLSPLIQLKGLEKRYKLPMLPIEELTATYNKKLSYRRGTARCVVSVEILPIAMQQCRNYLYDKSRTNRSYEHVYSPER